MSGARRAWLATADGLLLVSLDGAGETLERHFEGHRATSVATGDGAVVAAVDGRGVQRRSAGAWEGLGLEGETVWTVALGDRGEVYAGLEPAALWRLGGEPSEIDLSKVANHDFWHSPWGPANVNTVIGSGDRILVGVEVGGVAVSGDRGATWDARNDGLYEDVHHVVAEGDNLFATTGMGFHRSNDGGRTWSWDNDGVDRGYTQGLTMSGPHLVMSSSSGPPPMWEDGGPEAAIFVAPTAEVPLHWDTAFEGFTGNVERQALQADGELVVAATTAGELIVSTDGAASFHVLRTDLPEVWAVAIEPPSEA
ncbi:MAG: hypothetical protein U0V73_10940 [Acidimicrobiia bacterium]